MKRCEVCNIDLEENNFMSHVQGKKHTRNVDADNHRKGCVEKSIFVSRIPHGLTKDNIVNFFAQFDVIERCRVEPHFAIIEFRKKQTADFLLSKPIWIGRHQLDIKRRKWNTNAPTPTKQTDAEKEINETVFAELKTKLQSQTNLEDEMTTFLNSVQLPEDEVEKNWQAVHSSLLKTLKPIFPYCEINRFGSSITGLCLKGSDIDIYLNIGAPIYEEKDDNDRSKWTPGTIIKEVKFNMYRNKTIFTRIVPIPKAKTPIIKFCHVPTSTSCDISFKHGLGVINSELIKKLLCLDVRIRPLMIILKFWAKTYELSGCGKFTNYAIVMMIIFYLQQPETAILPAIKELQKTCEPIYSWNWQVNFDRGAEFPPSPNDSDITQLTAGFFKLYSQFPFGKQFISPLDGLAHPREEIAKEDAEKGAVDASPSKDTPIHVQDPIELTNNITSAVSEKVLNRFQRLCAVGIEVCEKAMKTQGKPFLLDLFTTLPAPLENRTACIITICAGKTSDAGLPKNFQTRNDIEDKKKFTDNCWFELAEKLIQDALKRVFKLDVQTIKADRKAKQQKIVETSDVHFKGDDEIVLQCISNYSIIGGRKATSSCIDPTLSHIDKEALISDELVKKHKEAGLKPTNINFMCRIDRVKDPLSLVLQLRACKKDEKRFKPLASFLQTKFPTLVHKEMIHIKQYNKSPDM